MCPRPPLGHSPGRLAWRFRRLACLLGFGKATAARLSSEPQATPARAADPARIRGAVALDGSDAEPPGQHFDKKDTRQGSGRRPWTTRPSGGRRHPRTRAGAYGDAPLHWMAGASARSAPRPRPRPARRRGGASRRHAKRRRSGVRPAFRSKARAQGRRLGSARPVGGHGTKRRARMTPALNSKRAARPAISPRDVAVRRPAHRVVPNANCLPAQDASGCPRWRLFFRLSGVVYSYTMEILLQKRTYSLCRSTRRDRSVGLAGLRLGLGKPRPSEPAAEG